MTDSVIVVVANKLYLPHAKSLMAGCIRQGDWKGDFCLVCPSECNPFTANEKGIHIFRPPGSDWSHQVKFHLFSPYFQRWRHVLYLDCDVLIQGNLNGLVQALSKKPPGIYFDSCHRRDVTLRQDWEHFDDMYGSGADSHPELYDQLRAEFPHFDKPGFSSDVMFISPEAVASDTVEKLQDIADRYLKANPKRMDQQVANLLLFNQLKPLTKDYCTWFAFDDPGNRVLCPERGWRGDEEPVILHYWDMYAPWRVKTPDAGAYLNHRLNRVCHELYAENLAAFDSVFPVL